MITLQVTQAEFDALRSAVQIAYADDDAPIFEREGGEAIVLSLEEKFSLQGTRAWASQAES